MKRFGFWLLLLFLLVPWGLSICLAPWLGEWVDVRFGDQVINATNGRVLDVPPFVTRRLMELCLLWSALGGMIAIGGLTFPPIRQKFGDFWACVPQTILAFVLLNIWILVAEQTGLFWMSLYVGGQDLRMPSIKAELTTMRESKCSTKVAVLGSSQCHAQLDVGVLNRRFAPHVFFANLTFVGAEPLDMLAVRHHVDGKPDMIVCYLSELGFFHGISTDQRLFTLRSDQILKEIRELDEDLLLPRSKLRQATMARWIPLFRLRESFEGFLFGQVGPPVLPQHRKIDLRERAARFSQEFRFDKATELHERSLRRLVERASADNTQVVLISGSLSPLVSTSLPPQYRERMLAFLRELDTLPNVTLVDDLPLPDLDQYRDLTHMKVEYREEYTEKFASILESRILTIPEQAENQEPDRHIAWK